MTGWRKKQIENIKAGAEIVSGDGGYSLGTPDDPRFKEIQARWHKVMNTPDPFWPFPQQLINHGQIVTKFNPNNIEDAPF